MHDGTIAVLAKSKDCEGLQSNPFLIVRCMKSKNCKQLLHNMSLTYRHTHRRILNYGTHSYTHTRTQNTETPGS